MVTHPSPYLKGHGDPIAQSQTDIACALCQLPASRHITTTINDETLTFCCYGCRHIYEIVAPDLSTLR